MLTLAEPVTLEQEVRKSRFLAACAPIADEQEARAFVDRVSDASATHNCWAYRLGQIYRFSDDGEPGGTAGRPILAAIDGQGLDQVVVVVTRWFGGILLGSGGLMRAYGGTAAMALHDAPRIEHIETVSASLAVSFSDLQRIKARLAQQGVTITAEHFDASGPRLDLTLPATATQTIADLVRDLTRGQSMLALD
ncbi:hypothetical protein BJF93_06995 [Xaviernesmea oryzae]|uniref:YigZ family protein n=1 Tax=Xaviernesmea oryzae TaxID=464029 RepID=A0A1Q9ASK6_9HYPH|nr:YigZ family protein [Xaviernesmea oryzae]OLP58341.1 hypothetical protein BJF93_06995 [Xaviernesmea oryzae]SEL41238.1 uncharacterized protein, YigZ family [Xaviernesmea oryzae]